MGEEELEEVSTDDAFKGFAAEKNRGVARSIFCSLAGSKENPSHFIQMQLIYNYSGLLCFYEVVMYHQHRTLEPDEPDKVISVNLPPNKGIFL